MFYILDEKLSVIEFRIKVLFVALLTVLKNVKISLIKFNNSKNIVFRYRREN